MDKTIILLCTQLLSLGCVERIEFETGEMDPHLLVVDGKITQGPGPYALSLSYATRFGSGINFPVFDVQITIFDNSGQQEDYFEVGPGHYLLAGDKVCGQEGNTYFIEIRTREGTTYRSQPETMPPYVEADSVYYELGRETIVSESGIPLDKRAIKVYINTPVKKNGQSLWFRWEAENVYSVTEFGTSDPKTCYIIEKVDPQQILLFSSENTSSDRLSKHLITTNLLSPTYAYATRHYYNVYQHTITRSAYDYWEKVDKIANQVGSIFDAPPATIQGNIFNVNRPDEIVLGYFQATAIDTVRAVSFRQDFPEIKNIFGFCRIPTEPSDRSACGDCLQLKNSTLEMPPYWGE